MSDHQQESNNEGMFDYIIAGGGHSGCVIASRLSQYLPRGTKIALVEAGPNAHDDPTVQSSLGSGLLMGSDLHWNDTTIPQKAIYDRCLHHGGGKALSGGTTVNYGTWTRGHSVDFDEWARLVGDDKWNYQNLLPSFKRTETYHAKLDANDRADEHGTDGPIHMLQSPNYPLGDTILRALVEASHTHLADANSGQPLGFARWVHNWRNKNGVYYRQPAGDVYDLSDVTILTNTPIRKVLLHPEGGKPRVTGIELVSGGKLYASREVIVCCGALRSPQLLMLSGIGEAKALESLGIDTIVENPHVGANLSDHISAMLFWKLKYPEKALALGHPNFDLQGIAPGEWLYTGTVPKNLLVEALQKDGMMDAETHPHVSQPRAHYELTFGYFAGGVEPGILPEDGSVMMTGVCNFLPTARGSVKLRSANPLDPPLIDPQYLTTEHDLCILRSAVREAMRIMSTRAAQTEIESQFQLAGANIAFDSPDADIDERIRKTCITWYHPAGTAAMGKVVDTDCKVIGVDNLRVVDASILPVPLAAHYQAPIYAIAEKAAEIIAGIC